MKAEVDQALRAGDSVGGIFEVVAHGVPPGLGSHAQWDEKLDGRLARAVMSIQAVKAVEIGTGIGDATSYGSEVQDEIRYDSDRKRFKEVSNRAGGIEGGITNGEDVVVRGYLKPISTLRRALASADLQTKETLKAAYERSDVCVVPAAGVAAEAMVAQVLADAFLEKFGGDSLEETRRNFRGLSKATGRFLERSSERNRTWSTMIHPITKYPAEILETPTQPVGKFDAELAELAEDMFESMYAAQGVGLAAPQIGLEPADDRN